MTDNEITCAPPDELHEDDLRSREKRNAENGGLKDQVFDNQKDREKRDVLDVSYSEADIPKSRQKRAVREITVSYFFLDKVNPLEFIMKISCDIYCTLASSCGGLIKP